MDLEGQGPVNSQDLDQEGQSGPVVEPQLGLRPTRALDAA